MGNVEFDPHAAIRKLAEMERDCRCGCHGYFGQENGPIDTLCEESKCTGRIVPFKALRMGCVHLNPRSPRWHGKNAPYDCDCDGRGWVPEPDVERACWRIFEEHPEIVRSMIEQGADGPFAQYEVKEALIRAALAWAQGQQK